MSNQYAIDGLKVKLSEIGAAIRATEQRLKTLASERVTIAEALRIMGGQTSEGAVSLGIATGTFTRTILEVLRDAEQPMGVRDIAAVLAKRAPRPLDKRESGLLNQRIRNVMPRLSDQLEGELRDRTTFWRVRS
jgi:hypothetical protein